MTGPRVAIVSVGLGRIQRGYERWAAEVFHALKDRMEISLYKSAGPQNPREKTPRFLAPMMSAARILPFRTDSNAAGYRAKNDCVAFSLTLLPELLSGGIDVIHVVERPLAVALVHLRRVFGFPTRIVFCDGALAPPQHYPRVDHVQQVSQAQFDKATASGIPPHKMTLLPCGLNAGRFSGLADRSELRRKHGIPESAFLILAVSALNYRHKRVDHLIEEVSGLSGDVHLWIDGRPEEAALIDLARERLGARCRISYVPSAQVPELYRIADVFVHAALEESFGLAVCEAAASGLNVLVHDSPHFRWLIGNDRCLVDMSVPGALRCRLQDCIVSRGREFDPDLARRIRRRFDWSVVAPQYIDMYREVVAGAAVSELSAGRRPLTERAS